jgi:HD-like signal output (HDOD) protein
LTREIARVAIDSERCNAEEALDEESVIARLAPADLAKVAITIAIHDYLQDAFNLPEDRGYWAYTLACALCCAELSEPGKLDPLLAYAAGMLHDVGRLALIQAYPEKYANLLTLTNRMFANDQSFDLLSYERMLFGLDHFATAAWLAVAWRLPVWLRPIVGKFDEGASVEHRKLIETVRAGTRLAHSLGFGFLKAAPRMEVRTIINQLPGARERWKSLDAWQLAEEHLRLKIQTRLMWYGVLSSHGT